MPFQRTHQSDSLPPADAKRLFIGRQDHLSFFLHDILEPDYPSHNIVSVSGQGGVGKTTLLQQVIDRARTTGLRDYCLTVLVNERHATPASVMEAFADQFRESGHQLKKFEEELTHYKDALRRMHLVGVRDEQETVVRDVGETVGTIFDELPVVGSPLHQGVNTLTDLALEKVRMRQYLKDAARLEDPLADLTTAFVKDLNHLADTLVSVTGSGSKRPRRVLLCFDTFERVAADLVPWLLDHFLENVVSATLVLVITGRDSIEATLPDDPKRWLPLLDSETVRLLSLKAFTEDESRLYLEQRGITDAKRVKEISHLSRGLPLYLSMLTSNPEGHIDPNAGVVENFLRWIPKHETQKRQLALHASLFSLPFTKDDLAAFSHPEPARSDLYQWLITQPFVQSHPQDGRHSYHDLARDLFQRYLSQRSQADASTARKALATYYHQRLTTLQVGAGEGKAVTSSRSWNELALALIQQTFLLPDGESHLLGVEYVLRMYEYTQQSDEPLNTLYRLISFESNQHLTTQAHALIQQLVQYLERGKEQHHKRIAILSSILEYVKHFPSFPVEVLSYIYYWQARLYRFIGEYQQALENDEQALLLTPQYSDIYAERGQTYYQMGYYREALADFDRALTLNDKYAWALASRGETYRLLDCYQEALTDFDRSLTLNDKNAWALGRRGQTYQLLDRYQEALTDFDRSLTLNDKNAWIINARGETYRLMGRYQEALADFDRAIILDDKNDWSWYNRALIQVLTSQLHEARRAISIAHNVAQSKLAHHPMTDSKNYRLHFNIALYLLADRSIEAAQAEYSQLLSVCQVASLLRGAADDLKDWLTIQPDDEPAKQILHQLETRIEELKDATSS